MSKSFKTLIIGAGSIGGLIDSPQSSTIASHAHAYYLHPDTFLDAVCEPNELNIFAFMERWGDMTHYASIDEIPIDKHFDIVSVSSSTEAHFNHLATVLKRSDCSYILCEKPLVASIEEFHIIVSLLETTKKRVLINLIRRYNPSFISLAERINTREFGSIVGFHGVCTKGLLHNGIHLLGVISHFLGSINTIKPLNTSSCEKDICGEFGIALQSGNGTISVLNHLEYSLFEITFWFEKGVIKILEGGEKIEIYQKIPSPFYQGYFTTLLQASIQTSLSHYALDTLNFLLDASDETCQKILYEHLHIHKLIFQTISKAHKL